LPENQKAPEEFRGFFFMLPQSPAASPWLSPSNGRAAVAASFGEEANSHSFLISGVVYLKNKAEGPSSRKRKKSMALVIDLKPHEKILIGEAVITNDSQRTRLHIAGDAPILREKDVMQEQDADTPCKKIYFLIQCMYLSAKPAEYHKKYFELIHEIQHAAPTSTIFFMQINDQIMGDNYYKAMKLGRQLIEHERELVDNALRQANK
jgi:flagellar biosynthesis repressor protein FlbT